MMHTRGSHMRILLASLFVALPAAAQTVSPQLFNDMKWRLIGPFRAGRSVAVSGVPGEPVFYFGAVDGGVWKTTDAGTVWTPIFDKQPVASIGALAVSASDPRVIYAGTGETDIRSDLASGTGVYKSIDGGQTWTYAGLKETRQIAKIAIDPNDPNVVYVGALGHAYGPNAERGIYKSTDGGATWKHTLDKGPDIGAADLAIAIQKPNVLFASMWNAHRPPWSTYAPLAGPGSGIYRSIDGGETWQPCAGHGLPDGDWGRTGVAVSADGERVYALIEAKKSGLYVSNDGGLNWTLANADPRLTSRAWYFNRITADPSNPDVIYIPNVALMFSVDGGKNVAVLRGAPGGDDYHELWVDPKNGAHLVLGTDQGTTVSLDRGKSWSTWYNQPTAQMYHVITDDRFPYTVYGAQQDSGSAAVLSRTDHGQITPRDWFPAGGSESGYIAVDPKDPDILYESGSYGAVARWDRRRSLSQDITPWPVPIFGTEIAMRKYRDPWTPPLAFSTVDKTSLYLGAQYVLKTTDGGLHWEQISPDLTGSKASPAVGNAVAPSGNPSTRSSIGKEKQNGPTPDNAIERGYGTLATVAPSYIDRDVIWAGSDTGIISVTRDGGKTWANVTPPGMQPWSRVSLIDPSHFAAGAAYAAVERHRVDDQAPYIFRTKDFGKTWASMTAGLAAPAFVNAVREDPQQQGLLYAGTEFGMYFSVDDGDHWQPLQLNLPVTSVRDLVIHGDDLVIATHGRSFWILDDITPLRQVAERKGRAAPFLYRPQKALRIDNDGFPGTPLPPEEPTAENPPNGAILDYYLPSESRNVVLRIYDAHRKLVQQISSADMHASNHAALPIAERWFPKPQQLESSPGMHRFVWNLAWGSSGVPESDEPDDGEGDIPRGPRVVPGSYSVELETDGKVRAQESLLVAKDPRSPATQAEFEETFATAYRMFLDSLNCRRALAEIGSVKEQLNKLIADPKNNELATKAKELAASADAVVEGAGAASLGLDAANQELTSAMNMAESSDRRVPSQALAVYAEARLASAQRIKDWAALKTGPLATLNLELKSQGLAPIAIAEIEREVHDLMTR
ncbi:MAG: WD40/YVTN/BNR-like repeat-containing protein [Terracidiphilus sp.]